MVNQKGIRWTNKSALALAQGSDPIEAVQRVARDLVLKARESGWEGPPFNPIKLVEMLNVQIAANSSIADARVFFANDEAKIEYNPKQTRERVRFSIAHELAHLLFPDWSEEIRNRGEKNADDEWQLEMLCNLAASEFVLPIGSIPPSIEVNSIEDLMVQRREFDVSVEAFLIRVAKVSNSPIGVFFASTRDSSPDQRRYTIDYYIPSPSAPAVKLSNRAIPIESAVRNCTAIGYTDRASETWVTGEQTELEFVGLPAYPGSLYPRVAGIVRFSGPRQDRHPIRFVHGNILDPRGDDPKVICQLVNDRAVKWGGGVARKFARKYPEAENSFYEQIIKIKPHDRIGRVVFTNAGPDLTIASIIAQEGFGPSLYPRLRYSALQQGIRTAAEYALTENAGLHMPRIGTGTAGGDWGTIAEIIEEEIVSAGLIVTIYDLPPNRKQFELFS